MMALGLAFVYVPLGVIVVNSFNASTVFAWPPQELTTHWWQVTAGNAGVRAAVLTSVEVALLATAVAMLLGTLLAFVIVCIGIVVMRKTNPDAPRPYRTPLVPLVPALGVIVCFAMMYSLDGETWMRLVIWLGIGLAIYFGYSRSHSHLRVAKK